MLKIILHIMIFFVATHVSAETDDWTSYGKDSGGVIFPKLTKLHPKMSKI